MDFCKYLFRFLTDTIILTLQTVSGKAKQVAAETHGDGPFVFETDSIQGMLPCNSNTKGPSPCVQKDRPRVFPVCFTHSRFSALSSR